MGPDALVVSWKRVSRERRRALEMLWAMTSSGYFLTRSDIARESSSSCSKLSSAIRRLYLRACEKTILSLQLSAWNESVEVPHSQWVFCTVLWRVYGLLGLGPSCLGRIFVGWSVER